MYYHPGTGRYASARPGLRLVVENAKPVQAASPKSRKPKPIQNPLPVDATVAASSSMERQTVGLELGNQRTRTRSAAEIARAAEQRAEDMKAFQGVLVTENIAEMQILPMMVDLPMRKQPEIVRVAYEQQLFNRPKLDQALAHLVIMRNRVHSRIAA